MERKLPGKKLGIPREVVLFLEVFKDAVLFATGKCRKFQQADVLFEWKAPKVSLRKLFFGHYVFSSSYELIFILIRECCICG